MVISSNWQKMKMDSFSSSLRSRLTLSALTLGMALCSQAQPVPEFKLKGSDNLNYTQASWVGKPTLVVFLKKGCPMNPEGAPYLNKLATRLKGSVRVVGFMNATLADTQAEVKKLKLSFPVVADPTKIVIGAVKAKRSFDLTVFADKKSARFTNLWTGTSQKSVGEALAAIQKAGFQVKRPQLSFLGKENLRGCSF